MSNHIETAVHALMDRQSLQHIIDVLLLDEEVDKTSRAVDKPWRTPGHPKKSHAVVTNVGGKRKLIRFGEQGAKTAGAPKSGESDRMKSKRTSFKARHRKNIARGKSSAAYWANKVKW